MGQAPKLFNKLLYVDLREFEFNILDIPALDTCKVCGTSPSAPPEEIADRLFEETCARDGRRNFVLAPRQRIALDIKKLEKFIKKKGFKVSSSSRFGITFQKSKEITACMLKSGIMNAQTPPHVEEDDKIKKEVFEIYRSIMVEGLGLSDNLLPEQIK
jgi:hypothetical protein